MYLTLEEIKEDVKKCEKCNLCKTRTNTVFGVGNEKADIMFIGEGPGADEDIQGEPFVGKAGKLMNQAFLGLGIHREKIYIANIVKCRPPNNRNPLKEEAENCLDYLRYKFIWFGYTDPVLVKPKIIVLLGRIAMNNILGEEYKITRDRGKWVEKNGIMYIPTWHPAALLRDETKKIEFWNDLKLIVEEADKNKYVY